MSATAQRVTQVISEQFGIPMNDVTPEKKIVDQLGADSLDVVELVMALEDEFSIEIPNDEAEKVSTVQDAIDLVTRKVG